MTPKFFSTSAEFRKWLFENHESESELLVGFYKVASGKPSMTWDESVTEALCFGWIDGVRRRIDDERYSIRFTPRNPGSIWSAVNIKKAQDLIDSGRMLAPGLKVFEARKDSRSAVYSYENAPAELPNEFEQRFRADKSAWAFFSSQPGWYRRTMIHHIVSAKQEKTRLSRLEKTIFASKKHERLR
jgi:uncharacterized protein YdeI (YjbR/CyaY-like superfamily)